MKRKPISKSLVFNKKQMAAAIAAAPDTADGTECPYDPNDARAVETFWAQGKVRLPGQRGRQKRATKVAVTVRFSPDVVEYFKGTGAGWQTRMNEALMDYVALHRTT